MCQAVEIFIQYGSSGKFFLSLSFLLVFNKKAVTLTLPKPNILTQRSLIKRKQGTRDLF